MGPGASHRSSDTYFPHVPSASEAQMSGRGGRSGFQAHGQRGGCWAAEGRVAGNVPACAGCPQRAPLAPLRWKHALLQTATLQGRPEHSRTEYSMAPGVVPGGAAETRSPLAAAEGLRQPARSPGQVGSRAAGGNPLFFYRQQLLKEKWDLNRLPNAATESHNRALECRHSTLLLSQCLTEWSVTFN